RGRVRYLGALADAEDESQRRALRERWRGGSRRDDRADGARVREDRRELERRERLAREDRDGGERRERRERRDELRAGRKHDEHMVVFDHAEILERRAIALGEIAQRAVRERAVLAVDFDRDRVALVVGVREESLDESEVAHYFAFAFRCSA